MPSNREDVNGITNAEIASYMGWRGPGAYTVHAMRKVRAAIEHAVRQEREACAKDVHFADNGTEAAEIIRARGMQ